MDWDQEWVFSHSYYHMIYLQLYNNHMMLD